MKSNSKKKDNEEEPLTPKYAKMRERLRDRKKISEYSMFNRMFFSWVAPLIDFCNNAKKIHFDMMNELEVDQKYINYANKMDQFFIKHRERQLKKKGKPPRSFYLKLILDAFKWDFILQIFCILVVSVLSYSSSYFIQQIFAIQYLQITSGEKVELFGLYVGLMIFFKVILILANNNLGYIMTIFGTKSFYATSHLIIKKTIHTSFTHNSKYNIGEIINLGK